MQQEWNGSQGYVALRKETQRGTPPSSGTPIYCPWYQQSLVTDPHLIDDQPAVGVNWKIFQALAGVRSHGGSLQVMCEPNTLAHWANMTFKKKSTTGSGPYQHTYDNSVFTRPDSYTMDISLGSQVIRYMGVESGKLGFGWDGEKMVLNLDVAALHAFSGREIASVSTTTIVLKTDYDENPSFGLVANDLVRIVSADGQNVLDTTVQSITDGTHVVLGATAAAFAAGDMIVLRPATPSLSVLTPFTWPLTRFYFADNATNALAAAHTPMDTGTEISLMNDFEDKEGAKRSGSYDPASLPRVAPSADFKGKKFFGGPGDIRTWNAHRPTAAIMRCWTDNTKQYEMRVTLPSIYTSALPIPSESDKTIYEEPEFMVGYSQTDGKAFSLDVFNQVATV